MKRFVRHLFVVSPLLLLFAGCSGSSPQRTDSSYLTFIHLTRPVSVTVDDAPRFIVEYSGVLFRYPAGPHTVNVYSADSLLLTERVLLERGKTTEVYLP